MCMCGCVHVYARLCVCVRVRACVHACSMSVHAFNYALPRVGIFINEFLCH